MLKNQISKIIDKSICFRDVYSRFIERLNVGDLTRDENPKSHFCVYFLPYNSKTGKVFIVHHKKANKWLAPGGHIDKGEIIIDTLNREIKEELGVEDFFEKEPNPFLLTITSIKNETQSCREHLDIWYLMKTNGSRFDVDAREFYKTKWMTIDQAKSIITCPQNLEALRVLKKLYE